MTAQTLGLLVLAIFGAWGALVGWHWRRKTSIASAVYAAKLDQNELLPAVSETDFTEAFVRSETPRLTIYMFAAGLVTLIALPLVIVTFNTVWVEIWTLMGERPSFQRGELVHAMMLVFVYGATFFAVCWFVMKRYHSLRPPSLRAEIRRLNAEAEGA